MMQTRACRRRAAHHGTSDAHRNCTTPCAAQVFGEEVHIPPVVAAMLAMGILLGSGVINWREDCLKGTPQAWDTLFWFGGGAGGGLASLAVHVGRRLDRCGELKGGQWSRFVGSAECSGAPSLLRELKFSEAQRLWAMLMLWQCGSSCGRGGTLGEPLPTV